MADIAVQKITKDGITPTFVAAAAGGDTFTNNGKTFLIVKNANGTTSRTVTIDSLVECNQGFDHNIQVSVPALDEKWIGPFEPSRFNNSAGKTSVSYDSELDLTIAAISL